MRKKAIKKASSPRKAVVKKPKYKDASTQTYRYVEYIPLPIVVDIKSENESDDAASYTEQPFNDEESYNDENGIGHIVETLKIEISEVNHLKQPNDGTHPPMIEEFLFDDKVPETDCTPVTVPITATAKQLAFIEKKSRKRTKSNTTRKPKDGLPKAKRAKKLNGEQSEQRKRRKSTAAKPDFVECTLCNFTCKRPSHLARHFLSHTGEKPHQCEHCPKSFAQKTDLNRHMSLHAALFPTHCDSCGRGFPDDATLKKHQQRCNTKRYTCDICNYMTFSVGNLHLHKRKHTGERPFACGSCDKRFTRVAHLNQHVKLHANDFEMHCSMCGRGFSDEEVLLTHEMTCKNRMFQCHMCRDTHIRMDNLRRHIKITHMGEKEILCEYCSKQFPAKSSLNKHIKFKHPERAQ